MGAEMYRSGSRACFGGAYLAIGQPERWVEWCRTQLPRVRDTHAFIRSTLVLMLNIVGSCDEAIAAAPGAIDAAEATQQPVCALAALLAYGFAFREARS